MREDYVIIVTKGDGAVSIEVYKTIENILREKDLSIAEAARMCNLADSTLRGIITRKQKNVALEVAFKISNGLNVTLEELNGEEPRANPDANEDAQMREIAKRIENRRKELELSYQDLASLTGVNKTTLHCYSTGSIKNIPLSKIVLLAKALKTSPEYLMGWDTKAKHDLDKSEAVMLDLFRQVPDDQKEMLLDMIRVTLKSHGLL